MDWREASGIVMLCLVLMLCPVTGSAATSHDDQRFDVDIPALNAASALNLLAKQTGATFLFPYDVAKAHRANPVRGRLSVMEALSLLLKGSGISPGLSQRGAITIALLPQAESGQQGESSMNTGDDRSPGAGVGRPWAKRHGPLALIAGIVGALFSSPGATETINSEGVATRRVIEEVVVTATRRDTSLQDTPLSISALRTEDLERQGIENFEDFSRLIPGVVLSGGKNFEKFTIRGIQTSATTSSNGEQKPVAVYYDDVPVTTFSVVTPDLRLYDVKRVEVMRGPQGTSFGSGSMAGAVRVILNKADLDGFDASLRVDGGSTRSGGWRKRYSGMVNVPLTDTTAVRAVGYIRNESGYIDNVGTFGYGPVNDENKSKEWGARTSFRWEPNNRVSTTLLFMHDKIHGDSLGSFQQPGLGKYRRATFLTEGVSVETNNVNLTVDYDFDWASLVSSTTYAKSDTDWSLDLDAIFGAFMPFGYSESQNQRAVVQELRLVSNTGGRIDWLGGLFYLDRRTDFFGATFTTPEFLDTQGIDYGSLPHIQSPGVDLDPNVKVLENTESAVFGELTYHLTSTLSAGAGIRYTRFEYRDRLTGKGNTTNLFDLIFGGVGGVAVATPDDPVSLTTGNRSAVTTKFTLNWQPNDDQTFYVTAAEGFRRPHPNGTAVAPNTVDPNDPTVIPLVADSDSLWNYELGMKTRLLDGRVQANVAVYFIDWKSIQLSATRGSDAAPYTTNSGDVESKGLEAEFLFWALERLELGLNVTFAKSEITSLSQQDAIASGEIKGAPLAAPESQFSGFAQYVWPLGNGSSVYARADYQYVDKYPNARRALQRRFRIRILP